MLSRGNDTHQELSLKIHDLILRLEEAQETMNEGVLVLNADQVVLYANRRFADLVGVELSRIIGVSIDRFVPLAQMADFVACIEKTEEMPHCDDLSLIRADGDLVPVLFSINPAPLEHSETGYSIVVTLLFALGNLYQAREALMPT